MGAKRKVYIDWVVGVVMKKNLKRIVAGVMVLGAIAVVNELNKSGAEETVEDAVYMGHRENLADGASTLIFHDYSKGKSVSPTEAAYMAGMFGESDSNYSKIRVEGNPANFNKKSKYYFKMQDTLFLGNPKMKFFRRLN
jgi:hypothetical protein